MHKDTYVYLTHYYENGSSSIGRSQDDFIVYLLGVLVYAKRIELEPVRDGQAEETE